MAEPAIEVYITHLGDTISGLATRFADTCDLDEIESYQQRLIEANRGDLRLRRFLKKTGVIRPLPAFSAIIIPRPTEHRDFVSKIQRKGMEKAQHIINTSTAEQRHSFAKLLNHTDIDLERLAVALRLVSNISESTNPESDTGNGLIGELASGTMTLGDAASGYYGERVRLFQNSLSNVSDKVNTYAQASGGNKAAAKQAYLDAHMEMNERFNREIDSIIGKRRPRTQKRHFLRNANRFANKTISSRRPFVALDTEDIKPLLKQGSSMKMLGRTFNVAQIAISTYSVLETYQADGNWQKEAFTESAGLLAGEAMGAGMLLSLVEAPSLPAIFVIGGASVATAELGRYVAEYIWDNYLESRIESGLEGIESLIRFLITLYQFGLDSGLDKVASDLWSSMWYLKQDK